MNKRDITKNETKDKIKRVILALISKKSFNEITIREICKEAGISLGSFYNYYNNKEEIVFEAIDSGVLFTSDSIMPLLKGNSGLEDLNIYLNNQCELYKTTSIDWLRVICTQYLSKDNKHTLVREGLNYQLIYDIILRGQHDGTISKKHKADEIAWLILKIILGNMFAYCMEEGNFDIKEITIKEVLSIV